METYRRKVVFRIIDAGSAPVNVELVKMLKQGRSVPLGHIRLTGAR
jgi:hypothetical protein